MSIFGNRKKQLRGCGCRGVGLGAVEVPWWCWDKGGKFDACAATAFKAAQNICIDAPAAEKPSCISEANDRMLQDCISDDCPSSPPASTPSTTVAATTTGGSVVCPPGQWPDASFTACVKSTGACSEANVIKSVQAQIGTVVDGKWGPNSAAALKASGKTYQQLAPGCSGAVPGGGSGGGSGTYKPPVTGKTPIGTQPGLVQAGGGFLGIPLIAWAGVAAVAGVLLYAKSRKKQAVANRRRRRRHHR